MCAARRVGLHVRKPLHPTNFGGGCSRQVYLDSSGLGPIYDLTARIDQAGCFSFITFGWVFAYLWSLFRNLTPTDNEQWLISKHDASDGNMRRLDHLWHKEVEYQRNEDRKQPSLVRVVLRFLRTRLLVSCTCFLFCLTFGFIGPTCIVRSLLQYAQTPNDQKQKGTGFMLALLMLLVELSRVIFYGATWAVSTRTALRVRGALLALLFKRFMHQRVSCEIAISEINSIFANDSQRIFDAVSFLPLVLIGPLVLFGGIGYLLVLIGPVSLVGIGVFLLFDVVQIFIGRIIVSHRKQAIVLTEKRIQAVTEILICIRTIKMSALENPFMRKVRDLREEELKCLRKTGLAQSLAVSLGTVVPVLAAVVTFAIHIGAGHDLHPDQAFSAITVFFVMLFGIRMIPYGMRYVAEALVALRKIQAHLMVPELTENNAIPSDPSIAVEVKNSTFCWTSNATNDSADSTSNAFKLRNGDLVGLCGPVGCGKSSLLLAIVGDMMHTEGSKTMLDSVAYCPQEPWIFNASFRENILLGKTFRRKSYSAVVSACNLKLDVKCFTAGDLTEIGENGVNLSGGQKARLSLARALYMEKEVYLLDDILSPVDEEVAMRLFNHAIKERLSKQTVILVTKNPRFLQQCDKIIFMSNGTIEAFGRHEDLICQSKAYSSFIDQVEETTARQNTSLDTFLSVENPEMCEPSRRMTSSSSISGHSNPEQNIEELLANIPLKDASMMTSEENLCSKTVSWNDYESYIRAIGGLSCVLLLLFTFVLTDDMLVLQITIKAAKKLHNALFDSIMKGNMHWFDTMPSGRIINRFSKDVDEVDTKIPFTLETLIQNFSIITGYLIIIIWAFPWFLVAAHTLVSLELHNFRDDKFLSLHRSLKRAENTSRSPLFSHIIACAQGKSVLRTSGKTMDFIERMKHLLDQNSSWMFMYNSAMRWLAVWLDFLVVIIVFVISLLLVALSDSIEPAYAGMALSYAIQFAVRMQAEFEAKMISVERMNRFIQAVEQEDVHHVSSKTSKAGKSIKGSICFSNVSLTYGKGAFPALKNVSFEVKDGSRLGILGRTGSGKTSLVNALLCLYPTCEGTIKIDNRNVGDICLSDLRSKIAVIPQDPRLFSGSIRFNLDPHGARSEAELWKAVDFARLRSLISRMPSGLESMIEEGGRNFSAGERQLIFLGRAFLQQASILLLDEATAYLNSATDIDECLGTLANQRTVLIVAHRLRSIMSCDYILILEQGRLIEFGEREALLSDPESRFSRLFSVLEKPAQIRAISLPQLVTRRAS
ncbi:multidrug Resistance protein family member [Trichuris trichiura]|uniref:Multidrug Resistance protein family member n=1 Tax=Trichuris trichiura TaxID=36087 RepID=A0A077Z1D9_TRITR|nr:multidrug Resistance protein family member [Trichuris trichiura]